MKKIILVIFAVVTSFFLVSCDSMFILTPFEIFDSFENGDDIYSSENLKGFAEGTLAYYEYDELYFIVKDRYKKELNLGLLSFDLILSDEMVDLEFKVLLYVNDTLVDQDEEYKRASELSLSNGDYKLNYEFDMKNLNVRSFNSLSVRIDYQLINDYSQDSETEEFILNWTLYNMFVGGEMIG